MILTLEQSFIKVKIELYPINKVDINHKNEQEPSECVKMKNLAKPL